MDLYKTLEALYHNYSVYQKLRRLTGFRVVLLTYIEGFLELTQGDKPQYRPEHNEKPNHGPKGAIYSELALGCVIRFAKGIVKTRRCALDFGHNFHVDLFQITSNFGHRQSKHLSHFLVLFYPKTLSLSLLFLSL